MADGTATLGSLIADELTTIGEVTLAVKIEGSEAMGAITNGGGLSWHCVMKAGKDIASV